LVIFSATAISTLAPEWVKCSRLRVQMSAQDSTAIHCLMNCVG